VDLLDFPVALGPHSLRPAIGTTIHWRDSTGEGMDLARRVKLEAQSTSGKHNSRCMARKFCKMMLHRRLFVVIAIMVVLSICAVSMLDFSLYAVAGVPDVSRTACGANSSDVRVHVGVRNVAALPDAWKQLPGQCIFGKYIRLEVADDKYCVGAMQDFAATYDGHVTDDPSCFGNVSTNSSRWRVSRKLMMDVFQQYQGAHRADLCRFVLLFLHGGFWFDDDVILWRRLDQIFMNPDKLYMVYTAGKGRMNLAMIYAPSGHPLFRDMIYKQVQYAVALRQENPADPRVMFTVGTKYEMALSYLQWCVLTYTCLQYYYNFSDPLAEVVWRPKSVPGLRTDAYIFHEVHFRPIWSLPFTSDDFWFVDDHTEGGRQYLAGARWRSPLCHLGRLFHFTCPKSWHKVR